MSIQRFETGPRMSQVVVHGNTVYLAGVVANKTAGESVTKQTEEILSIIDGHLASAGSDKSKLLTATSLPLQRLLLLLVLSPHTLALLTAIR